jgi:anti-anti-sigma regulatory factor
VVDDAHYAVVMVAGELDLATAPELRRTFASRVSCDVGLDIGELGFIDPS